jgi:branched-chain amino acid transport system permease protein
MTTGGQSRVALARDYWIMSVLLAALVAAPSLGLYPVLLMKILCFALFAAAFNLLLGYSGLLSFGHAAFFGGAAYVTGYLCKDLGVGPGVGILAGTAFALALGWVFGSLAIRRAGIYFAMITLALAQMMYFVWLQVKLTGGEDGLQGIPRGRLAGIVDLSQDLNLYYFVLAVCAAGFWIIYRAIHSPFGEVLKAIRENEPRAISLGYDVDKVKLLAFVLSAGLAGLAGSTKCLVLQLASLTDVHWHMSGEVVLMTLLGGLGTVFGPLVGAALVVVLQNAAVFGRWTLVAQGLIFVVCVLVFRRGIVGEIAALFRRVTRPQKP